MRTLIGDVPKNESQKVELMGWVANRRDHGKLIFIDLRDRSGVVQLVFIPSNKEVHESASRLRAEWVIRVTGECKARPENMANPNLPNGRHEVLVDELEILNEAQTPPIAVDGSGYEIGEESRMKYRYLDLRRDRLQKNIRNRAKVTKLVRDVLSERDFVEIETPVLSKSTPEGARDYLVPSRIYPGKFYALPQSPQQYKQLLMTGGFERYFQIARCFRDEDTRGDRQPEFTQLDIEMSFTTEAEVMGVVEEMLVAVVGKLYPNKKIQTVSFPRLTYKEAMDKHGTDRPDLREDKDDPNLLAFCWVTDFPFFEKTDSGGWTFTHNPFSSPKPEHMDWLIKKENIGGITAAQYDIVLNGFEIGGGSIRNHRPEALKKVFEVMGFDEERTTASFGHMLEALASGAPPHGGIAWGLDRLLAILENEPNIREVIAFPKTGDGRDPMMDGPSGVSKDQLKELGIEIKKPASK